MSARKIILPSSLCAVVQRHIALGLIPAASIAPKAAVPRTPPPRSPHRSPERPRSALAAAILSSSLTGQTWAIPPARPRSFSETEQSESFTRSPLCLHNAVLNELSLDGKRVLVGLKLDWSKAHASFYLFVLMPVKLLPGSQTELQSLRQHAQELVDENDALKLTVHRLNVELSRYQARFRPLPKQEVRGLPKTGSPPPWLLDMKYLCPLLLAYEDRMEEKDTLLRDTEEEVKKLRVRAEEVIKENEMLHDEIAKTSVDSQKDCQQLQQQALLVLQENQVLIDQLEAQHVKAKANHSRQQSEVTKMSKQVMLLEAEKQRLQADLVESRREAQIHAEEAQVLRASLKDAVTWDEHCSITGKLRRQLEQEESRNRSGADQLLLRASGLQEENRSLAQDKTRLSAEVETVKQRVVNVLCSDWSAVTIPASVLQQEKQGFVSRILKGTVRFGKLQDEIKFPHFLLQTRD
uniref:Centrosomal protein 89 n=1 Tax=Kryptolebias marmoratus TaxID=37003 RepID=A0A3Q3EJI6_KRYMA